MVAGLRTGLAVLFWATVVSPDPFGIHGGVLALIRNGLVVSRVSAGTPAPSATTVAPVHGCIEELAYVAGSTGPQG